MFFIVEQIGKIIVDFGCVLNDIGLLEVQVVLFFVCIDYFIGYFKIYKQDYYLCCGLLQLVNCCKSLFVYLKDCDLVCYQSLIECFGLCC